MISPSNNQPAKKKRLHWERIGSDRKPTPDEVRCCLRKTRFTKARAYQEIRKQIVQRSVRLYAYRCPYCLGYHLTHKKDYDGRGDPSQIRKIKF